MPSVWNLPSGAAGLSSLPGLDPTAILSIDTTKDRMRSPDASQVAHSGFCDSWRISARTKSSLASSGGTGPNPSGTAARAAAARAAWVASVEAPRFHQPRP